MIDAFFRSLAEHRKSQAIGVVLSGTGTDGTLGLAAIKAEGGIAFAQDQDSAKYPDMPRSASAQFGSADFVLPPAQIARELARVAGHPYVRSAQPDEEGELTSESQFAGIFQWVKRSTGVDFSQYKPSTLRRRILRRMVLNKTETVGAYLKRLENDPSEVDALYRDLLISVTSFFRDPETFEYLKSDVHAGYPEAPPQRFAHSRLGSRVRHGRGSVFHRDPARVLAIARRVAAGSDFRFRH